MKRSVLSLSVLLSACGSSAPETPIPATVESVGEEVVEAVPTSAAAAYLATLPEANLQERGEETLRATPNGIMMLTGLMVSADITRILMEGESSCPALTLDGNAFSIEGGGCVDDQGKTWSGSVRGTFERRAGVPIPDGTPEEEITREMRRASRDSIRIQEANFEAWGNAGTVSCPDGEQPSSWTATGSLRVEGDTVSLDLLREAEGQQTSRGGCEPARNVAAIYTATMTTAGSRKEERGEGDIGSSSAGRFHVATDRVRDRSVCDSEPLSGTQVVTAGDHTASLAYDGATNCDGALDWSLDGQRVGPVEVVCSAGKGSPMGAWIFGLAIAFLMRRRK